MFIYHYLFTLVLKSPDGEWPITYIIIIIVIIIIIITTHQFRKACERNALRSVAWENLHRAQTHLTLPRI